MSLHDIAQHLAARGRNGDSTLVHMTPDEVNGLQALAMAQGGSLSINPETGLPEANILKSLLPALAGVALTATGLSPLMAAGIVGGGTALATRNLGQGLAAGLGAFGGAGLGNAVMGLGAQQAAMAAAPQIAASAPQLVDAAMVGGINQLPAAAAALPAQTAGQNLMGGLSRIAQDPSGALTQMGGMRALARPGLMALAPTLTAQGEMAASPLTVTQQPTVNPYRFDRRLSQETARAPLTSSRAPRWFETVDSPARGLGMAAGGVPPVEDDPFFTMTGDAAGAFRYLMGQGPATEAPPPATTTRPARTPTGMYTFNFTDVPEDPNGYSMANPPPALEGRRGPVVGWASRIPPLSTAGLPAALPPGALVDSGYTMHETAAQGGLMRRSGGALLEGPGDGVSDSISGTIDGDRPVRVATGEFIFDARTVSEIGNGDTKAGAKKLYAVMDAIHQRRKSAKRGEPSGADGELRKLLA